MRSGGAKWVWSHSRLFGFIARLSALLFSINFCVDAQELPSLDAVAGKSLFEKNWVSAPASTAASDGLGPFFNARACAACHKDGGRGDAAETLNFVTGDPVYGEFLQTRAIQGLRAEGQVKIAYRTRIARLPDGTEVVLNAPQYEAYDLQYGPLDKHLSARIAPSLRGLGLLEQVPEQYLELLADPDDSNGDGISGRISKVRQAGLGTHTTGRFGWKAETASLSVQIARAFSLDMGLGTSLFPSAFGDCTSKQPECLQRASGNSPGAADPEVSDAIVNLVLAYLQSLGPARHLDNVDGGQQAWRNDTPKEPASGAAAGETAHSGAERGFMATGPDLFDSVGCSACHLPSIPAGSTSISPFTDLLLHDMGSGLAAEATESAAAGEWRTAPLWGLSAARSYLHDGRATTLAEAILWHGGEAAASVTAYSALTAAEREVLHTWLKGL